MTECFVTLDFSPRRHSEESQGANDGQSLRSETPEGFRLVHDQERTWSKKLIRSIKGIHRRISSIDLIEGT
jgi:hypothetical protein